MRASIVVVYYNGIGYLESCMSSLCAEIDDDEIILVDNASSDGGALLVQQRWPQARLIRNTTNRGFAAACNQAAREARGQYLVFLNQDTVVKSGWLQALLEGLLQGENVGLATSKLLYMSQPDRIQLCGQDILYTGMMFGRGTLHAADGFDAPQEVGAVSGASFVIRRSLWEQLGGFDEGFFMYYEETDLSWRASLLGYTSWYMPGSVALHDAGLIPSAGATYYSARNRPVLLLKHWKWMTFVLLLPALLATELVEWAYLLRLGPRHAVNKLRASAWLLGHPRQILHARKSAQEARKVSDARLLEMCAYRLSPSNLSSGRADWSLVQAANWLLALNYRLAVKLAQWLKI